MNSAQVKELLAMMLVGEGVVGTLYPQRYTRLWKTGPRGWRDLVAWWSDRPALLRLICAAELGVGIWLADRQLGAERNIEKRDAAGIDLVTSRLVTSAAVQTIGSQANYGELLCQWGSLL